MLIKYGLSEVSYYLWSWKFLELSGASESHAFRQGCVIAVRFFIWYNPNPCYLTFDG